MFTASHNFLYLVSCILSMIDDQPSLFKCLNFPNNVSGCVAPSRWRIRADPSPVSSAYVTLFAVWSTCATR